MPAAEVEAILGDGTTTTAHRAMAAVCDGDPQPILDIILDAEAEEYMRSRMFDAAVMLLLRDELKRKAAAIFLRERFMTLQPQATCYVWVGWQRATGRLGLIELTSLVETAFNRCYIDPYWCGFGSFFRLLAAAENGEVQARWRDDHDDTPFGYTIEKLSAWYCFSDRYCQDQERLCRQEAGRTAPGGGPCAGPMRRVGRKDWCPCGSGRKFKTCCLG